MKTVESIDTLVIGGGQAGLAMSEHLQNNRIRHVILERARIAESWRTARWDGLAANGPAWHDCFPTFDFPDIGPDDFASKDTVTRYFEAFAERINAPVKCGVNVTSVCANPGKPGFRVDSSAGVYEAVNVVCATGPFQTPTIPPIIPDDAPILQMHSNAYRNPSQLPNGAILVVGSGSSGAQIADELLRAHTLVSLSVGPHDRPPRRYRGRDFVWWLGVLGKWDAATPAPDTAHVTIAVSGAQGGATVDFRHYADRGMTLLGMTDTYQNGVLSFAPDLARNINNGDANYLSMLDEADDYVERNGLDLPAEPQARIIGPTPACVSSPIETLDLAQAGISTIIWATGYALDFSWLNVNAFDEDGNPNHRRGVSSEPGIYFLGLPWLSRRGSSFIWGVWHDAKFIADHITTQRRYLDYHEAALNR